MLPETQKELLNRLKIVVDALKFYHRYETVGLENIPKEGPCLLVCTHSLATYDISLLIATIYEKTGRIPRSLIDHTFFKFPFLGEIMTAIGNVQGTRENAVKLLSEDEIVVVAPGGMYEALRPSADRYQIRWDTRKGFVKLALESQTPLVLAACPKADDIFDVYPTKLTKWTYSKFKLPLPIATGIGPTPIPKPIKLVHHISDPIMPPKAKEQEKSRQAQVNRLHKKVTQKMESLIFDGVKHRST